MPEDFLLCVADTLNISILMLKKSFRLDRLLEASFVCTSKLVSNSVVISGRYVCTQSCAMPIKSEKNKNKKQVIYKIVQCQLSQKR